MLWLIGNRGMLGTELSRLLEQENIPHAGTDREVDITDPAALEAFARNIWPGKDSARWIINCAAYTAVDRAEDEQELCRRLNTQGAANIAACAAGVGAGLIHISTDYVFDGKGIPGGDGRPRPYREDDRTDPAGVYGLTKRDGETAVTENNPASVIIRTAWLYGQYGSNFVTTMLALMKERDIVSVVNDQYGSPTWARDLAGVLLEIVKTAKNGRQIPCGIYHYTNEGSITWYDFAEKIYEEARSSGLLAKNCTVKPCASSEYPARVKRPAYSVLDKTKIRKALGLRIPSWDESLRNYLVSVYNVDTL
ncbi:MAG: dTDP-4-dehydrorhamnose reductase [Treponema sp.]|nr:dTDP-4-dehydrorhamnose reductase [Treponema sp.]